MAFNPRLQNGFGATGTLATGAVSAGTTIGGNTLQMSNVAPGTLSAKVVTLAETSTVTLATQWQVSTDNSTWLNWVNANNTAVTVQSTGTTAADVAVTTVVEAPSAVYGWRYCRMAVVTGGTTAHATNDTYSIAYNFLKAESF